MIVFAFDRDLTVDTSEGPIPLSTIISLAKHFPAYAIGNQQLVLEANIPGRESLGPDKVYLPNAVVEQNIGGKHLRLQKLLKLYPTFSESVLMTTIFHSKVGIILHLMTSTGYLHLLRRN